MRKIGIAGLIFVGFVAGIVFVYSCGGGGSVVEALTDVNGIESRLDSILSFLSGNVANTDTKLDAVDASVNSINNDGVEGKLDSINTKLDTISNEIASLHNSVSSSGDQVIAVFDNHILNPGETFTSTEISLKGFSQILIMDIMGGSGWAALPYFKANGITMNGDRALENFEQWPAYGNTVSFLIANSSSSTGPRTFNLAVKLIR